ncbi:MAG: bifunctional metallophosphatase/5'-nucleotidase [Candidatus Riflebacteria bacterium]|nr:bifunctional metallophosphatase/5'-nucleotidase [Candidatus Riflebacteria bacterium]
MVCRRPSAPPTGTMSEGPLGRREGRRETSVPLITSGFPGGRPRRVARPALPILLTTLLPLVLLAGLLAADQPAPPLAGAAIPPAVVAASGIPFPAPTDVWSERAPGLREGRPGLPATRLARGPTGSSAGPEAVPAAPGVPVPPPLPAPPPGSTARGPGSAAAVASPTAVPRPDVATLTILYTNDTHAHLLPFDMPAFGKDLGGIARRAEVIRAIRAAEPHVLLFDGGDIFQGTSFYTFFKGEVDLAAFALMGYDATTMGNHELDDGMTHLIEKYKTAGFPLLCANILHADTRRPVFPTYRLFERAGRQIAVLGCIGSEAWSVIPENRRQGYEFVEPREALAPLLARLRPSADLVVLLSHSGYEGDQQLAADLPGLDVIIGGHTNTYLESPVLVKAEPTVVVGGPRPAGGSRPVGTLVVQAFKWGYYLGRLDLGFGPAGLQAWSGRLVPIDASVTVPLDSPVARLVSKYEERIRAQTTQIVGTCLEDLPYPEVEKHERDLPLGTFICETMREFTGADLAIMNSGSIRDAIPAGPVTMGRVFQVLPFDNTLVVLTMNGAAVQAMLQFICANYGQITGYQYAGLTATYDLDRREVRDIRVGGRPLEAAKDYRVVTINYLADGNQNGRELFREAARRQETGFLMRDALLAWLKRHERISPPPAGLITFVGPPALPTASAAVPAAPASATAPVAPRDAAADAATAPAAP